VLVLGPVHARRPRQLPPCITRGCE
jgi:hypothetical protein